MLLPPNETSVYFQSWHLPTMNIFHVGISPAAIIVIFLYLGWIPPFIFHGVMLN